MAAHRVAKLVCVFLSVGVLVNCGGGSPSSPTSPSTSSPAPVATPAPGQTTAASIAGSYNLVLTASSVCASNLPSAARVLRYSATIAQSGTSFTVSLSGGTFSTALFQGTLSGQAVSSLVITLGDVGVGSGLIITAFSGAGSVAGTTFSGTFNGNYQSLSGGNCNAFDHRFQFTRR